MKKFLKDLWDKPERMIAIVAVIGTVFIGSEIKDRGKELRIQSKNTVAQIEAVKIQSKIYFTQAFSRAIEQLGSDQKVTQLGAIHSLERLAEDSDEYYWPIMQVLTSYCKEFRGTYNRNIQEVLEVFKRRKYHYGVGKEEKKYLI